MFVEGRARIAGSRTHGNRTLVVAVAYLKLVRQLMGAGFVHCDPHEGNMPLGHKGGPESLQVHFPHFPLTRREFGS